MEEIFTSLFKYTYGMSSEEQLEYCLKFLPEGSRKSLSKVHSTRWLSYQINHLTRLIAAGRGAPNYSENLYNDTTFLDNIPKTFEFVGKQVMVPIKIG